jgi:hypothetical protein
MLEDFGRTGGDPAELVRLWELHPPDAEVEG